MGLLKFLNIDRLIESLTGLLETKLELAKLDAKEELSNALAKLFFTLILFISASMFLLFVSIGLGFLLNGLLESRYLGFIIVSGIYLVIFLSLFLFQDNLPLKKSIKKQIDKSFNIDE